jgi:hypothetical protein
LEISDASATTSKLSVGVKFSGMYLSEFVQLEEPPHEKRNNDTLTMLPKTINLFITMIFRVCKTITLIRQIYFIWII